MKTLTDLNSFAYTSATLQAQYIPRAKNTIVSCFKELNHSPKNICSMNESWAALALAEQGLDVDYFKSQSIKKYDTVLMLDEALCHFHTEQQQKNIINTLLTSLIPGGIVLFTLRDYRNGHFHVRPLGDTVLNQIDGEDIVTTEVNQSNLSDKQEWEQKMYYVRNHNEFNVLNCGMRRTVYFKQLAKYCSDFGNVQFGVFKELFWRGTWRRTPEHIAWVKLI